MSNGLNYRFAKRIVIAIIGGTVTLIGIALIVLPGPASIVIPIGLSILATEFLWAERWLQKARKMTSRLMCRIHTPESPHQDPLSGRAPRRQRKAGFAPRQRLVD